MGTGSVKKSLAATADSKKLVVDCSEVYHAADRFPLACPWHEGLFQAYFQGRQWEAKVGRDMTACVYHVRFEGTFLGTQRGSVDGAPAMGEGYSDCKTFLEQAVKDINAHLDFWVWERYRKTHGCNDIRGTAEHFLKNFDGHAAEIQDLEPTTVDCGARSGGGMRMLVKLLIVTFKVEAIQ